MINRGTIVQNVYIEGEGWKVCQVCIVNITLRQPDLNTSAFEKFQRNYKFY